MALVVKQMPLVLQKDVQALECHHTPAYKQHSALLMHISSHAPARGHADVIIMW